MKSSPMPPGRESHTLGVSKISGAHHHIGISIVRAEDFKEWQLDIKVLDNNPIYNGKEFRLSFKFTTNYPIGEPQSQLCAVLGFV